MRSTKTFRVLLIALLASTCSSAFGGEFLDTKPLLKDATATNPGTEFIVPFLRTINDEGDEYPERFGIRLRVYDAATGTKLWGSRERRVSLPPLPCSQPVFVDWDWDVDFLGEDNSRTGVFVSFYGVCADAGEDPVEVFRSMLYMADTRASNGVTWIDDWGKAGLSAHITNWDDDSAEEVMVILVVESDSDEDVTIKILNKVTGAQEYTGNYTISSF